MTRYILTVPHEFKRNGKTETRFCCGLALDAGDGGSGGGIASEHRPSPLP